ncbi:1,4-dihydroxy-2-naphthoyl-CoA synthase [Bacillus thermotolerans]|uniref:1,4-dihydroxy-2-naphthoyl-CoA synthase n=1 Tax=Bacillus thermotolerans TaxID=1221996 RepID=A0A0F5HLP5_BACTR|nr:1,4-dihydroxy-2-naphthoyl-CoA synthase [Bacillus thermotolerans]KKB34178.1 Naphthoate synthase [Bacillus thermotolerans]KKB37301.1 Naphthoate synthase [Bacillus thermotolerans]KKB39063.1 Naphthoate synthase [Bacillus thermotolerans]
MEKASTINEQAKKADLQDVIYEKKKGIAKITINRPEVYNAFRAQTVKELIWSFRDAWDDNEIGVVILTGTGEKAFCTGGDQKGKGDSGYDSSGGLGGGIGLEIEELHRTIRGIPKPVIAAVNGYAIGGGHVLHVVCDLTIASETAIFGQSGPKVGSYDAGYGTAYLARIVGEKKAREIWYLCEKYSAQEAKEMGLVNKVVPPEKLMEAAEGWAGKILEKSPTALKMLKISFNADSANIDGISQLAMGSLAMFYQSEESAEGRDAFLEKRPVDFKKFRK